ncbi:hypothetical protein OC834_004469 [Tilletia horrida]|nr:hypothetical protein OC834_004469 [Tilletia horrida]
MPLPPPAAAENVRSQDDGMSIPTTGVENDLEIGVPSPQEPPVLVENALEQPDNVFSPSRVAIIVGIATSAAFISPMTANVFLPALPAVAKDLNVSIERINLAIFIYMIAQGISPLFLGGSDALGRRSIYMICFVIYSGANAGLANLPDGDFAGLLVLRFMQACGSASMIAIGVGVISDVCTPQNRGSLMGVVQGGSTLGPAIGPVLGGVFGQVFGWRGIFWFCFILGAIVLALVLVFLPETLAPARANTALPILVRTAWIDLCLRRKQQIQDQPDFHCEKSAKAGSNQSFRQVSARLLRACWSPLRALRVLKQPEILLALLSFALPFACFYGVTVPLSDQFEQRYGLSTLQSGLVFLAPGIGVTVSSVVSGRLLDYSFRKVRVQFEKERSAEAEAEAQREQARSPAPAQVSSDIRTGRRGSDQSSQHTVVAPATVQPGLTPSSKGLTKAETTALFPLERARLEFYPYWTALMVAGFLGYGWTLNSNVHLSVPIIFTFVVGVACGGQFSILSCILVDYAGGKGASITAVNNLFRCLTGAIVSAVVQYIIAGIGIGWTQTIFALISLSASGIAFAMFRLGPGWRRRRFVQASTSS